MSTKPGWVSVEKTWMVKLSNQAVPRTGTPPDSSLLLEGAEERGSYIECLTALPYGVTNVGVIVHVWVKYPESETYFLLGSRSVASVLSVTLGTAIAATDLTPILPETKFPDERKSNTNVNRILKVGPGVKVYVGLDQSLSPGGITVWAHGGNLGEDDG